MMISPEGYIELNLKGKSASEISSKIRGLKNEIGRLKNLMEAPDYASQMHSFPSYETQLELTRQYLEKAKQALADAGGEYKPSQREQEAEAFDASVPYIEKIVLTIGGFFGGFEERTLAFQGDKVSLTVHHTLRLPEDENEFAELPHSKEEYIDRLTSLHIGEWKARYDNPSVMDGTQWMLETYFSNDHKKVTKTGSNAFPYNFKALCELMGMEGGTEEPEDDEE